MSLLLVLLKPCRTESDNHPQCTHSLCMPGTLDSQRRRACMGKWAKPATQVRQGHSLNIASNLFMRHYHDALKDLQYPLVPPPM